MTCACSRAAAALILIAVAAQSMCLPARASAIGGHARGPRSRVARARSGGRPTAPSGPPLVSGEGAYAEAPEAEAEAQAAPAGGEPLVDNGLGSPLCDSPSALSAAAKRNCETSDFVAASAPGIDYELDVHIDKGTLDLQAVGESLFQTWLVKRPWNALVWAVHAVLVAIEWSFTIDLLSSPAMGAVSSALRNAQRDFTQPWMAAALAVAAVLLAWRGIVRGRVAQSAGEAIAMLAMMACGLWMIADPIGTVGAVARWADLAGAQTLGAVSSGGASRAPATLADSMGRLFGATVNGPWCYLEFGNVAWCDDPGRLDSRLRASAMRIATEKAKEAGSAGPSAPGPRGEAARSARLLRAASTNGELFLALPANGPERNSIKDEGSLLYALCQSPEASSCRGPTAAEAEFRTPRGTSERFVGILLIAVGVVGMLLLFGFVVMRMLGASLLALLLLLAAPIVVLAPALGDGGRTLFKQWAARLFAAAGSKLIWSFLLGVMLVAMRAVLLLHGLGWWVQWLLLCILWWGSFLQRRRILVPSSGGRGGDGDLGGPIKRAYEAGHRVVRTSRDAYRVGHWTWERARDQRDRSRRRRGQEKNAPESPPGKQPDRGRQKGSDEREDGGKADGGGRRRSPGLDRDFPRRPHERSDPELRRDGDEHDADTRDRDGRGRSRSTSEGDRLVPRAPGEGSAPNSGDGAGAEPHADLLDDPSVRTPRDFHDGAVGERGRARGRDTDRDADAGERSRSDEGGGRGERDDGKRRDGSQADAGRRKPEGRRHVPRQEREQRLNEIVEVLRRGGSGESSAAEDGRGKGTRSAIDRQLRERRESERGSAGERRRRQFDWDDS